MIASDKFPLLCSGCLVYGLRADADNRKAYDSCEWSVNLMPLRGPFRALGCIDAGPEDWSAPAAVRDRVRCWLRYFEAIAFAWSSARFTSSTLTRGSPSNPQVRCSVCC